MSINTSTSSTFNLFNLLCLFLVMSSVIKFFVYVAGIAQILLPKAFAKSAVFSKCHTRLSSFNKQFIATAKLVFYVKTILMMGVLAAICVLLRSKTDCVS